MGRTASAQKDNSTQNFPVKTYLSGVWALLFRNIGHYPAATTSQTDGLCSFQADRYREPNSFSCPGSFG